MLKKKELVLLDTKENKRAFIAYLGGATECMGLITNRADHFAVPSGIQVHYQPVYQNIYVLASEESRVRRGDWYVIVADEELHQHTTSGEPFIGARKVIATSDPDLYSFRRKACPTCRASGFGRTIADKCPDCNGTGIEVITRQVPQISKGFIEKFRNKYCKGKQITQVMVECDEYTPSISHETSTDDRTYYKLKLSNNTVTIKKCKDSWDSEEIGEILLSYSNAYGKHIAKCIGNPTGFDIKQWMKENL